MRERLCHGRVRLVPTGAVCARISLFELGQAEVQNFHLPGGGQENIARLNVAVQNALAMRRIQGIRHLHPEVQQPGVRHRATVMGPVEALPFQQLHYDEGLVAAFVQLVDGADAGMVQRRGGARFAPETLQGRWLLACRFGQ